jgi:iron-sulfur cluster insertion protein
MTNGFVTVRDVGSGALDLTVRVKRSRKKSSRHTLRYAISRKSAYMISLHGRKTDMLSATENAKKRVAMILSEQPGKVFRVSIKGGGCSGFRYGFDLTEREEDDLIVADGIVTDHISGAYLDKAILEFKNDVFSQTFVLENPDVKTTCGCGESFGF